MDITSTMIFQINARSYCARTRTQVSGSAEFLVAVRLVTDPR